MIYQKVFFCHVHFCLTDKGDYFDLFPWLVCWSVDRPFYYFNYCQWLCMHCCSTFIFFGSSRCVSFSIFVNDIFWEGVQHVTNKPNKCISFNKTKTIIILFLSILTLYLGRYDLDYNVYVRTLHLVSWFEHDNVAFYFDQMCFVLVMANLIFIWLCMRVCVVN